MSNWSFENINSVRVKAGSTNNLASEIRMNRLTMIDELDNEEHGLTPNEFKLTLYKKSIDNHHVSN